MENRDNAINIRLMIFSGRPDPEWEADEALLKEIINKYQSSKERKESAVAPPPVLGYRGFFIKNDAQLEALPEALIVCKGVLTERIRGQGISFRDTNGLEELLLAYAKANDYAEILEELGY